MQGEFLDSPVADLPHVQLVFAAAIDSVDGSELLRQFAGSAELADDVSVQLHLVDLAVDVDIVGRVGTGAIEVLTRSWRDANRRGSTHIGDLRLERAIPIEDLNSLIPTIGNVHVALRIDGDSVNRVELTGLGPS